MINNAPIRLAHTFTRFQLSARKRARQFVRVFVSIAKLRRSDIKRDGSQRYWSNKLENNVPNKNHYLTLNIVGLILLQGIFLLPAQAANAIQSNQRVLMIEMTPALCNLQPSRARMRQCLEGYSLTVSGLDMGYGERCGRGSDPRLTPLQLKVVNRIMPDTTVRSQAWQHHGACSPLSASSYFRQITNYAGVLKLPSELNTGNSYTVSKSRFISQMTRLNSGMSSASVDLICQAGNRRQSVLTDIHVCYDGGQFGKCNEVINSCGSNFIISGGK
ncbi:ribonuclease T2 [Psychrobacter sp. 1U1]|uniref:ribonuclease T2 n=2 Tax=unclassified Psychrobacter TaxID=196806 RepID=UPI003F463FCC